MHIDRYRVRRGDKDALKRIDPDETPGFKHNHDAAEALAEDLARLNVLQEQLFAQGRHALLLIFQGMDAAGKDSAIKHVMGGFSPQGTEVHSFRQPSSEELDHDFLWRAARALPGRGRIGIFNRSYYEEVGVVRVHPEILRGERLPSARVSRRIWRERYEDINAFERHLRRNGTIVCKCFLHVSRRKQSERLLERLEDPAKFWKFSAQDIAERRCWPRYQRAYGEAIGATSQDEAPWFVIPADHKWFTHLVLARVLVGALESVDLSRAPPTAADRRAMAAARRELLRSRR